MSKIFVSGLVNIETTVKVRKFPIDYYPIDFPFFGVNSAVSGVGVNIAKALKTLGDDVVLTSMTGNDFESEQVFAELDSVGIDTKHIRKCLAATPASAVLYDDSGKRQIYCDLKDVQEVEYGFSDEFADCDIVISGNINFNRELLRKAKAAGKTIATDVQVLANINDDFNREFLENADILFLSDEEINGDYREFLRAIGEKYKNKIIVLGMGVNGALMYTDNTFYQLSAVKVENVVNTVGAGDSLFSAFLHYYAKGTDPLECLKKAEIFASEKIKTNGAAKGFVSESTIYELSKKIVIDVQMFT